MKRRKQIGKLIHDPHWDQQDVVFLEDYESMSREDKLDALGGWITELLEIRNDMIPNPKSWHHFMNDKIWHGLTDEELKTLCDKWKIIYGGYVNDFAKEIENKLKEKNA